jgi:uncharacterized protein (TIGR00661 family)
MRYLFIVQGDGRGHMTQAIALSDILRRNGHEVVEVLVGKSKVREIPDFFYKKIGAKVRVFDTLSFVFKKDKKHIHLLKTLLFNITPKRLRKYKRSIEKIHRRIKKNEPDVVVNFYELLTGLTYLRFSTDTPIVNIGHQYLLKHPGYSQGKSDEQGMMFLRLHTLLCGVGAVKTLALSFYPMKDYIPERIAVVPPLLRSEVLTIKPSEGNYILGYMLNQGYENEVRAWHEKHPGIKLHFFWDKQGVAGELRIDKTLTLHTIDDEKFLNFMGGCHGYVTTAGFESVCEALYLGKAVMMIPAHIEQEVNAADVASFGGGIVGNNFDMSVLLDYMETKQYSNNSFRDWVASAEGIFLRHLTTLV